MVAAMVGLVRRFLIVLLALTFAASGVVARQCEAAHHSNAPATVAEQTAQPASEHEHHDHAAHDGAQGHHVGGETAHQHGSGASGPMADDHMCTKCCGLCTVVTALAPDAQAAVIFSVSFVSFSEKPDHQVAVTIKVDPGIPKPIV
jgi:hypothetical protein